MSRKSFFWWSTVILIVLTLILGFENILTSQTYYILFFELDLSSTLLIFLSAAMGFLIGFFFMLYSFEIRREKEMEDEDQSVAAAPAKEVESKPIETAPSVKDDKFDEENEVLE